MINLEEIQPGDRVVYTRMNHTGIDMPGTVTSKNKAFVFVRYDANPNQSQATSPFDLEIAPPAERTEGDA